MHIQFKDIYHVWCRGWKGLAQNIELIAFEQPCPGDSVNAIANLQKMVVAERREAEPTTGRRNELGLAVRQATIELLAESCRQ